MFPLDKKYFQRLLESAPDIIIAVDKEGMITFYNDGARTNLGYSSDEIIGQNCTLIYPSLEEARRVMKAMRAGDNVRISSFETVFRNKAGEMIPVTISGSLIHDDDGNEIGSIGFARDIRRMRHAQQLATAGEIAVSLAHEINNPLESIINNLDLLSRCLEGRLSEAEKVVENERLDSIRNSIDRVQAIVRRLDEMTRKGEYETRDYLAGKRMADLAPRETAKERTHEAPHSPESYPLEGMSVIVLDDDIAVVNSLAEILRAERCIVNCATRPSAAFGILRNVKVDAVISDVVMPEMDGYDFYLKVKEEMPNLPVILMTAYYYDKDHILKRSRLRGLEGALFKKPVNPAKLRQMLMQLRQKSNQAKADARVAAAVAKAAAQQ
ncbi:MAG: PAS domain S-box protein [Candidatus Binatus sp.]|uniref:ATP-binding response regulator n=1 Tax=Candidatus Binatus sp. TaxID=2811406 RepID=UPI00271777BC|nr:hybrid sensor histidine kinase/response regulator [Candidatus Binatus sp.]MDO8432577.1 PAS domain S-box protein [Candidatus Binatus sp.]